jgi:hypothetical protein
MAIFFMLELMDGDFENMLEEEFKPPQEKRFERDIFEVIESLTDA